MTDTQFCEKSIDGLDDCYLPPKHPGKCLATCGDCQTGRCHWGSEDYRRRAFELGERCGCARHRDSVKAAELWTRYNAIVTRYVTTNTAPE